MHFACGNKQDKGIHMGQIIAKYQAIKYLRERAGRMSEAILDAEVASGRIPVKPFGNKIRFRTEDLDKWLETSEVRLEYIGVATPGTHTSRSSLLDGGLSFVKRLGARTRNQRPTGA